MKKPAVFFALLISILSSAQNFTWVKGSTASGLAGTYGTQSVSAASNNPGGRHGCAKWVDAAGNLWLFGGEGYSNTTTLCWMNDLWKYNISTNEWTWIRGSNSANAVGIYGTQGVASSTNEPGAREFAACWTDASGNFWMFGGDGYASNTTFGRLGDLWKYNPGTNQWTWIKGFNTVGQNGIYGTAGTPSPTNAPGCRYGAGTWKDAAGDFWLFGGRGLPATGSQGYVNDLWKYNVASNQWTWMSGSNMTGQYGIYGTMGTAAPANAPGGRYFPACWSDAGNLYMFAGLGFAASAINDLSDFWKYNIATNAWTWIGGSNGINAPGVYGTQGMPNALNIPGSRFSPASWTDASGNFWLFGGHGFATTNNGELNDLFRYKPATNEWTWIKGSATEDQNGIYGTQGVAAAANNPGGREYNTWWKDLNGKLWLFGGEGYDAASTTVNHMNDLWTFSVPCNPDSVTIAPGKIVCSGTGATLTAVNGGVSTIWYPTAASTTSIAAGAILAITSLTAGSSPTTYSYYAEANSCTIAPRASIVLTVNPLPTLTATASHTRVCQGSTVTLHVIGASTYTWNTTPATNGSSITVALNQMKTYTFIVTGEDANNCTALTTVTVISGECVGLKEISGTEFSCSVYPNPNSGEFTLKAETNLSRGKFIILNALGQKVFEQELDAGQISIKPDLPKALYFYQFILQGSKTASGKLVIE